MRWKNWRLYKYRETDTWQLFDLDKDPQELHDVAAKFPEAVQTMARDHDKWKKTLAPHTSVNKSKKPKKPKAGYGWVSGADS